MKTRITLFVLLIALLLLSTGAGALSAPPRYRIEIGTLPGGDYLRTSIGVQAGATSAGGAYRLVNRSAPSPQAGGGCCCTWAPCVLSHH
jgi:hypothetical protein